MAKIHTSDIRLHASDIRHTSTYKWHKNDMQVHTSDIWMTCECKGMSYE